MSGEQVVVGQSGLIDSNIKSCTTDVILQYLLLLFSLLFSYPLRNPLFQFIKIVFPFYHYIMHFVYVPCVNWGGVLGCG